VKRLLWLVLISCGFNSWAMFTKAKITKKNSRSWNTPRTFGTTHFIVGYDEKHIAKKESKENQFISKKSTRVTHNNFIDEDRITQSFFTTKHDLCPILLEVLEGAKKSVCIAAFSLTDKRIVDCLVKAKKEGIEVCVITDVNNMKQVHSKINSLIEQGVAVWHYSPVLNPDYKKNSFADPCMHHKFIIIDDIRVVTGSANFTKSGQKTNIENILVLNDEKTVKEYLKEIKRLKQFCIQCSPSITA